MTQLTQRETEVLHLAASGLTNDEIATCLTISRRTVEAHMRTLYRKTGATGRTRLAALVGSSDKLVTASSSPASVSTADGMAVARCADDLADCERRLRFYAATVRRLVDRQFPLFEERVEITVRIGEEDGQDIVVERRCTTPKPYLVYRVLRPILVRTIWPSLDPDDLALACAVHGQDIHVDVHPVWDVDGEPLVMVLFQPGLQADTEWELRYHSPNLWNPLRSSGQDTLNWATGTLDQRHQPMISELALKVIFPATWTHEQVAEQSNLGALDTERLATGETQVTWHDRAPVAPKYHWILQGEGSRRDRHPVPGTS